MPTAFRAFGYSFYFFSHEPGEPPHVHVDRGDGGSKVWLENVAFARHSGFKSKELSQILTLVRHNPDNAAGEMAWVFWHRQPMSASTMFAATKTI